MIIQRLVWLASAGSNPAFAASRPFRQNKAEPLSGRRLRAYPLLGISLVFVVFFALPVASADAVPTRKPLLGIIGQDDRVPLASTAWPWRALGRVNQANGAHCTGTLIAADKVLTAAHCLMDRMTGLWLAARDVVFVAGFRHNEDLGYARGLGIQHPLGAVDPRHPSLKDIPNDWAVLSLDRPLAVRPVPLHALPPVITSGAHLMRAGYSQDRPYLLSLHDGCTLLDRLDDDRVLVTDCDGTRGDSGSPLLLKQGKNVWVVGVTSAVAVRGESGNYAVHAATFEGQIGALK